MSGKLSLSLQTTTSTTWFKFFWIFLEVLKKIFKRSEKFSLFSPFSATKEIFVLFEFFDVKPNPNKQTL